MVPNLKNITRNTVELWLGWLCRKKLDYNELLLKSNNKPKTTSKIVKTFTNNKDNINNI